MKSKYSLILIILIAILLPAASIAEVHTINIQQDDGEGGQEPQAGVWVLIWVQTAQNVWTEYELETDASGYASTPNVPYVGDHWEYMVDDGPGGYEGPDPSSGDVFYPSVAILLNPLPDGIR